MFYDSVLIIAVGYSTLDLFYFFLLRALRRLCFQLVDVPQWLTHFRLASHERDLANSVDPDQTPQNAASDQGLHFLHLVQEFLLNMVVTETNQTPLLLEIDQSKVLR